MKTPMPSIKNKNYDNNNPYALFLFLLNILTFPILFLINPLYSIFILVFSNIFVRIKTYIILLWGFAYSILLSNKKYDISFIPSGGDDVIGYSWVFEKIKDLNFTEIFNLHIMAGHEPFTQILWWGALQIGLSPYQILFIQLFAWVSVLIFLANYISKRFSVFILMIGLGLYPEIIPYEFHSLYRSAWASMFLMLSIIFFKNTYSALAVFSHFASLFVIFFQLLFSTNIFQKKLSYIFVFFLIIIFYNFDFHLGMYEKISYYYSNYTHTYNLSIIKSQLLGLLTICLFYTFSNKDNDCKNYFYSVVAIYLITFIPPISWVSMRLFIVVAPIAFMVCAPLRNRYILYAVTFLCIFRYASNISNENAIYNAWGTDFIFIFLDKVFTIF